MTDKKKEKLKAAPEPQQTTSLETVLRSAGIEKFVGIAKIGQQYRMVEFGADIIERAGMSTFLAKVVDSSFQSSTVMPTAQPNPPGRG